jgi:hypothetical protein
MASQGLIKFISINLPEILTKRHLGGVILKMQPLAKLIFVSCASKRQKLKKFFILEIFLILDVLISRS